MAFNVKCVAAATLVISALMTVNSTLAAEETGQPNWSPATQPVKVAYPKAQLSNGLLEAEILLPDPEIGYYRGPRFDWSGMIGRVSLNGHVFFGVWKTTAYDPLCPDDAVGPAEEFGMTGPLGFEEAKPGETFIKIGVGHLKQREEPRYSFNRRYEVVQPAPWTIRQGKDFIEFQQRLSDPRGWGYDYTKRVSLTANQPELRIEHSLTNTGTRAIDTDQYCHNFIMIDDRPVDSDVVVELPYAATAEAPERMNGMAVVQDSKICFRGPLTPKLGVWTTLGGRTGTPLDSGFKVVNTTTGASVSASTDRVPYKVAVWASIRPVSVEPFITIKLAPGEQMQWTANYTFAGAALSAQR